MSMLLRRRLMVQGGEPPAPTGTYIYMIKDVPTTQTDTGIKLGDTNKAYTILTEMSFPNTSVNANGSWAGVGSNAIYCNGTMSTSSETAASLVSGSSFFRIRFFEGNVYQYAKADTFPYLSNDGRHRFAHWHAADSATSTIELDGYGEKTTTNGTFAASNDTLLVKATVDQIVIHALYIYDKVLTEQEISDYISDGIIP